MIARNIGKLKPASFLKFNNKVAGFSNQRNFSLFRNATINNNRISNFSPPILLKRTLFIRTSETPNPNALKFLPNTRILPDNRTIEFLSGREAFNSPLARKLFAIDGISSILLGSNFLTIEKNIDIDWSLLKPEIFSVMSDYISSGEPIIDENAIIEEDVSFDDDDDEVVSMIKELIFTRIRPAIQDDGGDIEYVDFTDEGIVFIRLRGACRSCDSSAVTLKNGIEAMLKHYIEEVKSVQQVEDEAESEREPVGPKAATLEPAKRSDAEDEVPPIL